MRVLAPAFALLAFVWVAAFAAEETPEKHVVFVCEHGKVKSLMAASYFNQLATEQGLPWRAVARGSAPGSTKIDAADAAEAARIVVIGTDLPAGVRADEQRIERWNDVPPASSGYDAARSSLKAHIRELLERLRVSEARLTEK
jgi:arsenate reductase (thioredoxin)